MGDLNPTYSSLTLIRLGRFSHLEDWGGGGERIALPLVT